jgi:hypothetical protein
MRRKETRMAHTQAPGTAGLPWNHLAWILGAGVWAGAIAAFFAGTLHAPRSVFLLPYTALVAAFLFAYFRWSGIDLRAETRRRWMWGALGAVVWGAWAVRFGVWPQPSSARADGWQLAWDVFWLGIVYGAIDGLLLSVMPMVAAWRAGEAWGWTARWPGRIATALLGLAASLLVTTLYHLGYPELRNARLAEPLIGNGMLSVSYLVTANPIAPVGSHIVMHIGAVFHGPASVSQLPPH